MKFKVATLYFVSVIVHIVFSIEDIRKYNSWNHDHNVSNYSENNATQIHIYKDIVDLMHLYKSQHNKYLLESESLENYCNRKFLLSEKFSCLHSIGNKLSSTLSDFLAGKLSSKNSIAVIVN